MELPLPGGRLAILAAGEQGGQQILHLRIHEKGRAQAQLMPGADLLTDGLRVIVEDEVGGAVPGVGKIPGAEIPGLKGGGGELIEKG